MWVHLEHTVGVLLGLRALCQPDDSRLLTGNRDRAGGGFAAAAAQATGHTVTIATKWVQQGESSTNYLFMVLLPPQQGASTMAPRSSP